MSALYELEQSVIGAVLLRPENLALLPSLATLDFQGFKARVVWEAIRNLEAAGLPIDTTTIGDEIAKVGKLEAVGWDFIGECTIRVPSIGNAIEYARRVKDAALKQRLLEALDEIKRESPNLDGAELLTLALGEISKFDADQPDTAATIGDIVKRRVKQLEQIAEERATGKRTLTGFPTGVEKLDEKMGGWQAGIVSIVAARPAMGKSSLGLSTADACSRAGFGVHVFSLEDTWNTYADRSVSRESGVAAEKMRNSELNRGEMEAVGTAFRKLAQRKGWLFDDRSGITADEIIRSVRRRKRENGTRVVIVDYVQMVKKPARTSTHEALTEIVTLFADAAKQDGLAYVVMSQLNRELEKRTDKRPQLADLRESGSLEERAKCVVGVYRGSVYGGPVKDVDFDPKKERAPSEEEFEQQAQLLVLKNSNGRTGVLKTRWHGPTTRLD